MRAFPPSSATGILEQLHDQRQLIMVAAGSEANIANIRTIKDAKANVGTSASPSRGIAAAPVGTP